MLLPIGKVNNRQIDTLRIEPILALLKIEQLYWVHSFLNGLLLVVPSDLKRGNYVIGKESNSTANEGKRQFNRSIIYFLNIVPIVNDSFWKF